MEAIDPNNLIITAMGNYYRNLEETTNVAVDYTAIGRTVIISKRVKEVIFKRAKQLFDEGKECYESVEVKLYTCNNETIVAEVDMTISSRVVCDTAYYTSEDTELSTWCTIGALHVYSQNKDLLHYVYGEPDRAYSVAEYRA